MNSATLGAVLLVGAALATAMVAGLTSCFAHSVMPGLSTLADRDFLVAFRRIDAAISNPWMMSTFLGSPVLTTAALLQHLSAGSAAAPWLVAALALVAATVLITGVVHLPLNAAVQGAAPELPDAALLRSGFEERWVRWNVVRAATSTAALGALLAALSVSGRTAA